MSDTQYFAIFVTVFFVGAAIGILIGFIWGYLRRDGEEINERRRRDKQKREIFVTLTNMMENDKEFEEFISRQKLRLEKL